MCTRLANALIGLTVVALGLPVGAAHAQSFSELARDAVEVPEDVASWAAPLLTDCRSGTASVQRQCVTARRRGAAAQLRGTYILDLPALSRVSIAPYEPHNNGFRIRIPGLAFTRTGAPGVVATARFTDGAMSPHVLAEGFARVSREAAGRFRATNALSSLRVRVVFRIGADWTDAHPSDPSRAYGVTLDVVGAQVYNERTGNVLADSLVASTAPQGAPLLTARTVLWNRESRAESAWLAPDGETVLFHTRIEPVANQPGTLETTVLVTHDAAPVEIVRFVAPCCSATVDLRPHGDGVLMIITEVASTQGNTGRGRVLYLKWNAETDQFDVVARWEGDNRSEAPAWLRDPAAVPRRRAARKRQHLEILRKIPPRPQARPTCQRNPHDFRYLLTVVSRLQKPTTGAVRRC